MLSQHILILIMLGAVPKQLDSSRMETLAFRYLLPLGKYLFYRAVMRTQMAELAQLTGKNLQHDSETEKTALETIEETTLGISKRINVLADELKKAELTSDMIYEFNVAFVMAAGYDDVTILAKLIAHFRSYIKPYFLQLAYTDAMLNNCINSVELIHPLLDLKTQEGREDFNKAFMMATGQGHIEMVQVMIAFDMQAIEAEQDVIRSAQSYLDFKPLINHLQLLLRDKTLSDTLRNNYKTIRRILHDYELYKITRANIEREAQQTTQNRTDAQSTLIIHLPIELRRQIALHMPFLG